MASGSGPIRVGPALRSGALLVLAAVAFVGCQGAGTCDGGSACRTDGGAGGGAATGGGGAVHDGGAGGGSTLPRTVTVTRTIGHWTEQGRLTTSAHFDASVALLLADGGVFSELPGTASATSYTVADVPAGEYVVKVGSNYYVALDDTLDLGVEVLGRSNTVTVDGGTTIWTLDVSGLPTWSAGTLVQVSSVGAGLVDVGSGLGGPPQLGTTPTRMIFDYGWMNGVTNFSSSPGYAPVLDARWGDTFVAVRMAPVTLPLPDAGALMTCALAAEAAHGSTSIAAGTTTSTTLAFSLGASTLLPVQMPLDAWHARATETHPRAVPLEDRLSVNVAIPDAGPGAGFAGVLASCLDDQSSTLPGGDLDQLVPVSAPFPAQWSVFSVAATSYAVGTTIPDAGAWQSVAVNLVYANAGTVPVPGVHAPTSLVVQGVPAATVVTARSTAPLDLSWAPNGTPAPVDYLVELESLSQDASRVIHHTTVASALTRRTGFSFPAGLLDPGGVYTVRVTARVVDGPQSAPLSGTLSSSAAALSNHFLAL